MRCSTKQLALFAAVLSLPLTSIAQTTATQTMSGASMTLNADGHPVGRITNVQTLVQSIEKVVGSTSPLTAKTISSGGTLSFTLRTSLANPLKKWYDNAAQGTSTTARKTAVLTLLNQSRTPVVEYELDRAWPSKVTFDKRTSTAIVESVTLTYEALTVKKPSQ